MWRFKTSQSTSIFIIFQLEYTLLKGKKQNFDLGGAKILKIASFKPKRINGKITVVDLGHNGLPGQQWSNTNKNEDAVIFGTTRHREVLINLIYEQFNCLTKFIRSYNVQKMEFSVRSDRCEVGVK